MEYNKECISVKLEDAIAKGMDKFFRPFLVILIVLYGINCIFGTYTDIGKDDTDPESGRSGLNILVDDKTRCEYLTTSNGGITPRLNEVGKPSCTNTKGYMVP